jgi:hypothetical protein
MFRWDRVETFFHPLASDVKNIYNFPLFTWKTEIDRHTLKMGAVCPSETLAASVTTAWINQNPYTF